VRSRPDGLQAVSRAAWPLCNAHMRSIRSSSGPPPGAQRPPAGHDRQPAAATSSTTVAIRAHRGSGRRSERGLRSRPALAGLGRLPEAARGNCARPDPQAAAPACPASAQRRGARRTPSGSARSIAPGTPLGDGVEHLLQRRGQPAPGSAPAWPAHSATSPGGTEAAAPSASGLKARAAGPASCQRRAEPSSSMPTKRGAHRSVLDPGGVHGPPARSSSAQPSRGRWSRRRAGPAFPALRRGVSRSSRATPRPPCRRPSTSWSRHRGATGGGGPRAATRSSTAGEMGPRPPAPGKTRTPRRVLAVPRRGTPPPRRSRRSRMPST